jgi:hypothetical protein
MYILYYVCGFAGGLALGALFKVPALVAATFAIIIAAATFVAFGDIPLTSALEIALPAIICMQIGYLVAAAVQGRR